MKYIVLQSKTNGITRELPIIFPDLMVHANVAQALLALPEMKGFKAVSAGALSCMDLRPKCHGDSFSLKLKSREEVDNALIYMMDYSHGVVA